MNIVIKPQIDIQNNHLMPVSKPISPALATKPQQSTAPQATLPALSPAYFHPSFSGNSESPPESPHLERAKRLKKLYSSKGLPYLLPHEVWSNEKIFSTIALLGKNLDKLADAGKLNKESVQETMDLLIPEAKDKIIIKDFADLEKDLKTHGYSDEIIQSYLSNHAINISSPNNKRLYFRFEPNSPNTPNELTILKSHIEHETKHALSAQFQNKYATNIFKNCFYKCNMQQITFNIIFNKFESSFYELFTEALPTQLTKKNLYKKLGVNSEKSLHNEFITRLKTITKEAESAGALDLSSERSLKQFFNCLKDMAIDEKEAYQSEIRYREILGDLNIPTEKEFIPMLYAEMEKFFEKMRCSIKL